MEFKPAHKSAHYARLGLVGPSGSGKTYSALGIAQGLGERVALIDTEAGSASKYAPFFDFDTLVLNNTRPGPFVDAMKCASRAGYDVLILDSITHEWMACLSWVDDLKKTSKSDFTVWGIVTPAHRAFIDAILSCPMHVIATIRSKMKYEIVGGKPKAIGMQPIQREGVEYEFDILGVLDEGNNLSFSKTRMSKLHGRSFARPGPDLGREIAAWCAPIVSAEPIPVPPEEVKPGPTVGRIGARVVDMTPRNAYYAEVTRAARLFKVQLAGVKASIGVLMADERGKEKHFTHEHVIAAVTKFYDHANGVVLAPSEEVTEKLPAEECEA